MMTAPRCGGYLRLHRYGAPRIFVGRWAADDGHGWWHDETGKRMTNVHSWEFITENSPDKPSGRPVPNPLHHHAP